MFISLSKPSPKGFQRIWQYIHPASEAQTTCNHIPGPPHPVASPPRPSETSHPDSCCNNRFTYPQNFCTICQKPSQGIYYACWCRLDALSHDTSHLMASGTMQVFSSWRNPGLHFTRQIAVAWVSSLLMSALWIKWPVVTVGLWYGQAHVKANENKCILLMAF